MKNLVPWSTLQIVGFLVLVGGLASVMVLYKQDQVYKISKAAAAVLAHEQIVQGGSSSKNVVTSQSVAAEPESLYLASISMKPYREVTKVEGLGLNWTKVKSQCGARNTTGAELWMATGSPVAAGVVTATLEKETENNVITVSRFDGADLTNPLGTTYGVNTKGTNGSCSGGSDTEKYAFDINTNPNSIAYAVVAERLRDHEPQNGFSELVEFKQGTSNGDKAGIAVISKSTAVGGNLRVEGKLNSDTDWAIIATSINGLAGTVPTSPTAQPSSTPVSSVTPTSTPGATSSPKPTATAQPTPVMTPTPVPTPIPSLPPTSASIGIWSSKEELASKPMSGDAWNEVLKAANGLSTDPVVDLDDQDSNVNVDVLAAAIVYARTGQEQYKTKVVTALRKVETFVPKGRSLAWGRETGAYAMAADLIGYRTPAFEKKMRDMAETYRCSEVTVGDHNATLLEMYLKRPNNWGAMAFGSLAAIYRYLGDTQKLQLIRNHYVQNVVGPMPATTDYDKDLSWQCKENDPRLINPVNCVKVCGGKLVNVEGIIPDDMRRGASCQADPAYTNYPWGQLEGLTMAGRILERAGMPIWSVGDNAICRAATVLQEARFGAQWRAEGDDRWQLPILDKACGKNWKASYTKPEDKAGLWQHGKNTGWGYVL